MGGIKERASDEARPRSGPRSRPGPGVLMQVLGARRAIRALEIWRDCRDSWLDMCSFDFLGGRRKLTCLFRGFDFVCLLIGRLSWFLVSRCYFRGILSLLDLR